MTCSFLEAVLNLLSEHFIYRHQLTEEDSRFFKDMLLHASIPFSLPLQQFEDSNPVPLAYDTT